MQDFFFLSLIHPDLGLSWNGPVLSNVFGHTEESNLAPYPLPSRLRETQIYFFSPLRNFYQKLFKVTEAPSGIHKRFRF